MTNVPSPRMAPVLATTLVALEDAYALHCRDSVNQHVEEEVVVVDAEQTHESNALSGQLRVRVRGPFVRKRKLSKGLIFGDVALEGDDLLEVMIRAQPGVLSVDDIKQINWDVHLGDVVVIEGAVAKNASGHLLLTLTAVTVEESWSETHPGEFFDRSWYTNTHTSGIEDSQSSSAVISTTTTTASVVVAAAVAVTSSSSLPVSSSSKAGVPWNYTNIVQIHGFNACKYYFAGANGANCQRGPRCHFWHGQPEDYAANRALWHAKRQEQRHAASKIDGDHHGQNDKQLKTQRARILCDWLIESLGELRLLSGTGVIDVAGGRGEIPIQLWNLRGITTTLIDPRPMKWSKKHRKLIPTLPVDRRGMCQQLLCCLTEQVLQEQAELFANCSLLVGMHPDEATEIIVDVALRAKKPFAIVPCCVMSRVFLHRQCRDGTPVATYDTFVRYLMEKDVRIQTTFLSFTGRNQVLYLFDYE